jgi:hypothetical protein
MRPKLELRLNLPDFVVMIVPSISNPTTLAQDFWTGENLNNKEGVCLPSIMLCSKNQPFPIDWIMDEVKEELCASRQSNELVFPRFEDVEATGAGAAGAGFETIGGGTLGFNKGAANGEIDAGITGAGVKKVDDGKIDGTGAEVEADDES